MDFNTLHKQRKFVLIAAALGVISMFLPWVKIPFFGSRNGMHGNGILIFIAFAAAGALAFIGDQKKAMPKNSWLGTLGAGAVALLFWLINFLDVPSAARSYLGIGFWICIIAAIAVLATAYMFRDPAQNLKQSLNSMTQDVKNKLDGNPNT